jgi:peptide/nickel transport system ATP-binding protein
VLDEPTTGLDVTTQAAVMDLIAELGGRTRMATVLITHDLGLAASYCQEIVVMHAGHVVEAAPTRELFAAPRHPYTAQLIAASPHGRGDLAELLSIPGSLPDLRRADLPPCRFSERCEQRHETCARPLPRPDSVDAHRVYCHYPRKAA